ncbi:Flp pilus assembly protein TadB [Thioalkalivibrio nitratireducens DSM 14787]|uniref:Flp pilus assembly protein TadB n=1 Tax=Thioalkalivibrio nitratireducens (strain DSM 14787 / UNIQEM 213 / ALEN2) TaxID=1255043 RepID=L0DYR1_THIND|nr:type II secretion system F family protein [Thioalkalivibrio nitratireducens]AGA34142.1 Flp pilus assembly protein TadB [Thioalkalivibrio nitratireducens DSM 14787]
MTPAAAMLLAVALVFGAVGLVLLGRSRERAEEEQIARRVSELALRTHETVPNPRRLSRYFERAGIDASPGVVLLLAFGAAAAGLIASLYLGWLGFLLGVGAVSALVAGALQWQYRRRVARIVEQLPGFLEHMIRGLRVGRSIDGALRSAVESSREPLRGVMERVLRAGDLGGSMTEAMMATAQVHRVRELQLLALGVQVNQRFGGSASELFENIVAVLRQRDRSRRQLRALTGETRVSAVVLAVVPIAIAGYMVAMNPDYYAWMLDDPTGRIVLFGAAAWQVLGIFLLWRMLKSV